MTSADPEHLERAPGAQPDAATRRRHRSAVAQTLLQRAPGAAGVLDWAELEAAPTWLGLAPAELDVLALRVGTVLLAPALRLWIAAPALQAAHDAMGAAWWPVLMSHADWPLLPSHSPDLLGVPQQRLDAPALAALFRSAGAAVMVSSLPHGAMRHAASEALAPVGSLVMPRHEAQALVTLAHRLVQRLPALAEASL